MSILRRASVVLFVAMALVPSAFANGLNLNGVGSRAIGMGGAFVGLADDPSAIFWNPAGLTQVQEPTLWLFETNLIPKATYEYSAAGIDTSTKTKVYPAGAGAFVKPAGKWTFGLGVHVPAGTGATWDGDDLKVLAKGATHEWESFMTIVSTSPFVAYKLTDKISLGASLNANYKMIHLKRPGVGQYEETLDGWSIGGTFGVHAKATDKFSLGLTVRTPSALDVSGDATMSGAPALGLAGTSNATREGTWPLWVGFGVAFKATDKLIFTADAQYTQWSKIDTIGITYDDPTWEASKKHPQLGPAFDNAFVLNWDDKAQLRFGAEYMLSKALALRAGYYYDPSPAPPETLNILLPEATYNAGNLGLGYKGRKLRVDFCIEVLFGDETTTRSDDTPKPKMPGTHGVPHIIVPNLSFGYSF